MDEIAKFMERALAQYVVDSVAKNSFHENKAPRL